MTEAEIKSVLEENEELRKQVSDRDEALANLNAELAKLQGELAYLRNKVFGHTSEKRLPLDPNQLSLFEGDEMTDDQRAQLEADVAKAEETITYSVTRKERPSRRQLDDSRLPVEEEHLYPDGATDGSGSLKEEYAEIGVEEKRVLETVPARVFIRKIIRHKVILKSDVRTRLPEDREILTPASGWRTCLDRYLITDVTGVTCQSSFRAAGNPDTNNPKPHQPVTNRNEQFRFVKRSAESQTNNPELQYVPHRGLTKHQPLGIRRISFVARQVFHFEGIG